MPEFLKQPYFDALEQLHDLAHSMVKYEWDELLSRAITCALVVAKGHPLLGETIMDLSPTALKEFRIRQGMDEEE